MAPFDGSHIYEFVFVFHCKNGCQESGRPYSRPFTSAVHNVKLGDQRHVVAVAYMMSDTLMLRHVVAVVYMMSDTLMLRHVVAVVYMTSDMLMLRSDVVVRR